MSGQMGERAARIVMSEIRGNLVFRDRNSSEFHVISGSDLSFVRTEVHDLFFAVRNEVRFCFPEFHSAPHHIFVRLAHEGKHDAVSLSSEGRVEQHWLSPTVSQSKATPSEHLFSDKGKHACS